MNYSAYAYDSLDARAKVLSPCAERVVLGNVYPPKQDASFLRCPEQGHRAKSPHASDELLYLVFKLSEVPICP